MSVCRTDIHSEGIAIATNPESNQKLLTDAAQDPAAGTQTCLRKASTLRGPNHGSQIIAVLNEVNRSKLPLPPYF